MRSAVDTNVISALWSGETTAGQMAAVLGQARSEGGLVVCAPVYAELLAHPKAQPGFVDEFLVRTDVLVDFDLDEAIWREAGRSFAAYARRRRETGAGPKRLLVDFIVGAHAARRADRLLTLDPARYARDFPRLSLLP